MGGLIIPVSDKSNIYYEIVSDDTPIHTDIAERMKPISLAELTIDGDLDQSSFYNYLMQKTKNVILFFYYVDKIEKIERKKFILHLGEQGEEEYRKQKLQIINSEIKDNVKGNMVGYLAAFLRTQTRRSKGGFRNILQDWYDFFQVPMKDRIYVWE